MQDETSHSWTQMARVPPITPLRNFLSFQEVPSPYSAAQLVQSQSCTEINKDREIDFWEDNQALKFYILKSV